MKKKKIKTFSFDKMKEGKWYSLPTGKEIKISKKKMTGKEVILCGGDDDIANFWANFNQKK